VHILKADPIPNPFFSMSIVPEHAILAREALDVLCPGGKAPRHAGTSVDLHARSQDPETPPWIVTVIERVQAICRSDETPTKLLLQVLTELESRPRTDWVMKDIVEAHQHTLDFPRFGADVGESVTEWAPRFRRLISPHPTRALTLHLDVFECVVAQIEREIPVRRRCVERDARDLDGIMLRGEDDGCGREHRFQVAYAAGPGIQWMSDQERPLTWMAYDPSDGEMRILVWELDSDPDNCPPCLYIYLDEQGRMSRIQDYFGERIWTRPPGADCISCG
jgi:hypothetical protein